MSVFLIDADLLARADKHTSPSAANREILGDEWAGPETPGVSRGRGDRQSERNCVSRGVRVRKNGAGERWRGAAPAARRCA